MIPGITASGRKPWTPYDLFEVGVEMAWYNPANLASMWQDTAATIPVTADGDVVARIDDSYGIGPWLQNGNAAQRPVYRTDGAHHWLEFDGVDDYLDSVDAGFNPITSATDLLLSVSFARNSPSTGTNIHLLANFASSASDGYVILCNDNVIANGIFKIGGTQYGAPITGAVIDTNPVAATFRWRQGMDRYILANDYNNSSSASITGTIDGTLVPFTIGKSSGGNTAYLGGKHFGCFAMSKSAMDDEMNLLHSYFRKITGQL